MPLNVYRSKWLRLPHFEEFPKDYYHSYDSSLSTEVFVTLFFLFWLSCLWFYVWMQWKLPQSCPCWMGGPWTELQPSWECHGGETTFLKFYLFYGLYLITSQIKRGAAQLPYFPYIFARLLLLVDAMRHCELKKGLRKEIQLKLMWNNSESMYILRVM